MSNDTIIDYSQIGKFEDVLTGILHDSAQQLLCKAVEAELGEFLKQYEDRRTLPISHKFCLDVNSDTGIPDPGA